MYFRGFFIFHSQKEKQLFGGCCVGGRTVWIISFIVVKGLWN